MSTATALRKEVDRSLGNLKRAQDKVRDNYKERFSLTEDQLGKLHMFFSPSRIPKGLTQSEVLISIMLHDLRDRDRQVRFARHTPFDVNAVINRIALPEELRRDTMTRSSFRIGTMKLLEQMATA